MLSRDKLRGYQKRGIDFVKHSRRAGLFLDMGLGKTVIVLTAISDLVRQGVVNRVLVVAPLRPAQAVWRQEARKWQQTRNLRFKLLLGNERQRLQALNSDATVHVINPENVRWLMRVLSSRYKRHGWPYDMLVVDESSMFKTPSAKRFTAIRHRVKHFDRRVIMTGTPTPKGLLNLWAQMYILDNGMRLGETVERYKSRFFSPGGFKGYGLEPDEDADKKILELISPIVLTMRAEDYLDLPAVLEQVVYVDMPVQARRKYEQLEREMFLVMEEGTAEALNAASLSSKCWQMANGALILETDEGEKTWQAVHDAKLQALEEIVDGTGSNLLVAYWFKHDLLRLKAAYPKAPNLSGAKGAAYERLEREWNKGKYPLAFIHPQSAGHGSNLQFGGNTMVFFSMLWSREYFAQCRERMGASRQIGLRDNVSYKYILTRDTVDEVMYGVQRMRHATERKYMRMLRDYHDVKNLLL